MTINFNNTQNVVLVAIDIAKAKNDILVQLQNGTRKKFKVANKMPDYKEFITYPKSLRSQCYIGLEATSNYHRSLAWDQLFFGGITIKQDNCAI